jgi:tetratricopeptide (TPR) repeat protein
MAQCHSNLGEVLRQQGKFAEAQSSYAAAIHLEPGDPGAYFNKGLLLSSLNQVEAAIDSFQTALRCDTGYLLAMEQLAPSLSTVGRNDESFLVYEKLLEINPADIQSKLGFGVALQRAGKLREASQQYEAVVSVNPQHSTALANLGAVYQVDVLQLRTTPTKTSEASTCMRRRVR